MTQLMPIREIGPDGRTGTLRMPYADVVARIGEPNCTDLDDPGKVKASWGFADSEGQPTRKAFVWCYYVDDPLTNSQWSICGSLDLLEEVFGAQHITPSSRLSHSSVETSSNRRCEDG